MNRSLCSACVVAMLLVFPAAALAVPADQSIEFKIYETPTDPTSDVVFIAVLSLTYQDDVPGAANSGLVGWEVTEIELTRPDAAGDIVWREAFPSVATSDGLWWAYHRNMDNPMLDEFVKPAQVSGTATPDDPTEDDLDYSVKGETYTPPAAPGEPPHPITAALDYSFQRAMDPEPIEDGNDEPVETDDGII